MPKKLEKVQFQMECAISDLETAVKRLEGIVEKTENMLLPILRNALPQIEKEGPKDVEQY